MSHTIVGSKAKVLNIHSISILKVDVTRKCWFWYIYDGCAFTHSFFIHIQLIHMSVTDGSSPPPQLQQDRGYRLSISWIHCFPSTHSLSKYQLGASCGSPVTKRILSSLPPFCDHWILKNFQSTLFPPPIPDPLMTHKSFHNIWYVTPLQYCGQARIWVSY